MPGELSPTYPNRSWTVNVQAALPSSFGGDSPWFTLIVGAAAGIPITALFCEPHRRTISSYTLLPCKPERSACAQTSTRT